MWDTSIGEEIDQYLLTNRSALNLSKSTVHSIAENSVTFRGLVESLDSKFIRQHDFAKHHAHLQIDEHGWVSRKVTSGKTPSDPKLLKILERLDSHKLRALHLAFHSRQLGNATFEYPYSQMILYRNPKYSATTDIITIDPNGMRPAIVDLQIYKTLSPAASDPKIEAATKEAKRRIKSEDVANELVSTIAHEFVHALSTYERELARAGTDQAPLLHAQEYRELIEEENRTRVVSLKVTDDLTYTLPRDRITRFLEETKDFRNMPVGYIDGLPFVERVFGDFGSWLSQAEVYFLEFVLKTECFLKLTSRTAQQLAKVEATARTRLKGTNRVRGPNQLAVDLKSWAEYRDEIVANQKKWKLTDAEVDIYTIEYVKGVLNDRRTTRDFSWDRAHEQSAEKWNAILENELKDVAEKVFRDQFEQGAVMMYDQDKIDTFVPAK